MTIGEQTIDWLYKDQLRIDDEWSIRTAKGFTWWADKHAQTVDVIGEEPGPDGDTGYLISVRTDFLRNLELTPEAAVKINALLMPFASMAGPVYDDRTRDLRLCSLVRVHREIGPWMNRLISVAAVLQIAEARIMAPALAKALNAQEAVSGHPQHGVRPMPDEMAEIVTTLIAPVGKEPCKWHPSEFQEAVDQYMQRPPSLLASSGGLGFTVEFPYGEDQSSLFRVKANQPHPRYGNGLFQLQSFPVAGRTDAEGAMLALSLNAKELANKPWGYGFGSYAYRDGAIHFTSFFPNVVYKEGLLPNIYYAGAQRALAISRILMNRDWDAASFSPRRSSTGRLLDRLKRE